MDTQRTQCNSDLKNRIKVQSMIVPPTSPIVLQNYVVVVVFVFFFIFQRVTVQKKIMQKYESCLNKYTEVLA